MTNESILQRKETIVHLFRTDSPKYTRLEVDIKRTVLPEAKCKLVPGYAITMQFVSTAVQLD